MRLRKPPAAGARAPIAIPVTVTIVMVVLVVLGVLALQRSDGTTRAGDPTATTPPTELPTAAPSSPDQPDCAAVPTRRWLSAVTLNIHAGMRHGRNGLEQIAREIDAWRVDVVLVQEIERFRERSGMVDQAAWLGRRLGMHQAFASNVVRRPARAGAPRQASGIAILSRYPIVEREHHLLPNDATHQQRGLQRVVLDVDGARIAVFNTHFDHGSAALRIAQARASAAIVARERIPVLLGGDLNAQPGFAAVRPLTDLLHDAWPPGGDPGLTVPASRPRRRIDFVLHDASFTVESARVLKSAVADHRAVRVGLLLAPAGACRGH